MPPAQPASPASKEKEREASKPEAGRLDRLVFGWESPGTRHASRRAPLSPPPWAEFSSPPLSAAAPVGFAAAWSFVIQRKAAGTAARQVHGEAPGKSGCACGTPGTTSDPCPGCLKLFAAATGVASAPSPDESPGVTVSQPADELEVQAERVAHEIMRSGAPSSSLTADDRDEDVAVRRAPHSHSFAVTLSPATGNAFKTTLGRARASGGESLPGALRAFMEPRLGHDLGAVRVHRDGTASALADAVHARAFTIGADIFFRQGDYQPGTPEGQHLIAHELAHVVQQRHGEAGIQRDAVTDRPPPATKRRKSLTGLPEPPIRELYVPKHGSLRDSVLRVLRLFAPPSKAERVLQQVTLVFLMNGQPGDQVEGEAIATKRGYYIIDAPTTRRLADLLGIDVVFLIGNPTVGEVTNSINAQKLANRAATPEAEDREKERTETGGDPAVGDWRVLNGNEPLSDLYLKVLERYARLKLDPPTVALAKGGLTADEIAKIVHDDPTRISLTNRFTQEWLGFHAAGGTDIAGHFTPLITALLDQVIFGNPNAVRNRLRLGKGFGFSRQEESILGIVLLPSRLLCYDDRGNPLNSPISGLSRDPGYAAVAQGPGLFTVEDPAIQMFLNVLRRTFTDPTRMAFEAANVYMRNVEEVNKRVLSRGITPQIREQFQESLPFFVGFLAGHGVSTLLLRSANPIAAGIGAALKVSLALAGYVFDIDFGAGAIANLLEAASHLVRVRKIEAEKLGALDSLELDKAAEPIRKIIVDVAQIAILSGLGRGLGFLLRLSKGNFTRLRLECSECNIKQAGPHRGEVGAEANKSGAKPSDVEAAPETADVKPGGEGTRTRAVRRRTPSPPTVGEPISPELMKIREMILDSVAEFIEAEKLAEPIRKADPNARIGMGGSVARGRVSNPDKPTANQPFDPNKFDLDLFVISDVLPRRPDKKVTGLPDLRNKLFRRFPIIFEGLKTGGSGVSVKVFRTNEAPPVVAVYFQE